MQLTTRFIKSSINAPLNELTDNCLELIKQTAKQSNQVPVMVTYFVDDPENYLDWYSAIEPKHLIALSSPFSIIAQPPADGSRLAAEVLFCSHQSGIEWKTCNGKRYVSIIDGTHKYIFAAGLQLLNFMEGIERQSFHSFDLMQSILQLEGMDFSQVVRQWNYIEQIVGSTNGSQHYQVFNDVRSTFYSQSTFTKGYPAATGIGSQAGGIIIDFIATNNPNIKPIKNPVQADAHQYSKDILGTNCSITLQHKTTPKFERAKISGQTIYISGTAAIKGQDSQAVGDAYLQTLITLDNIEKLVKGANAEGLTGGRKPEADFFRIYIKNLQEANKVKEAFGTTIYKDKPTLLVIADICRPELLVEIEGIFTIILQTE